MHVTWRFRIKELQASKPLFNITYPQVLLLFMKNKSLCSFYNHQFIQRKTEICATRVYMYFNECKIVF